LTCNYDLSKSNIESKFKVCLEYPLGTAKGLVRFESLENYQKQVDAIREILKVSRKV
jgi:excinuclease ABC subunit C